MASIMPAIRPHFRRTPPIRYRRGTTPIVWAVRPPPPNHINFHRISIVQCIRNLPHIITPCSRRSQSLGSRKMKIMVSLATFYILILFNSLTLRDLNFHRSEVSTALGCSSWNVSEKNIYCNRFFSFLIKNVVDSMQLPFNGLHLPHPIVPEQAKYLSNGRESPLITFLFFSTIPVAQ